MKGYHARVIVHGSFLCKDYLAIILPSYAWFADTGTEPSRTWGYANGHALNEVHIMNATQTLRRTWRKSR